MNGLVLWIDRIYVLSSNPVRFTADFTNSFPHPRTETIVREKFYVETHQLIMDQLQAS